MEPNLSTFLLLSSVAVRAMIVILILFISIRLFGKQESGDMNMIDVLAILLVSNSVQNALTYGSGRLDIGLVSAGALILTEAIFSLLIFHNPKIERELIGKPTIIFSDGRMDRRVMKRNGLEEDELLTAVRSMGLKDLSQVHLAVLEENGTISVIPKTD